MKRLYSATVNSLRGLVVGLRSEAALREETAALALGLPVGIPLAPTLGWYVAMIGSLLALLAVELLNTAIEKLADHVAPERHPEIGKIKDYGSAAVFCAIALAAAVWLAAIARRCGLL